MKRTGSTQEGCRRLERLELEEALGHVPSSADREFIAQHLAACESCRVQSAAAALMRHTDDEGAAVPLDELSRQRFVNYVVTQAAADGPLPAERKPVRSGRPRRYWVAAAAAVLLALGVGLGLTLQGTKDRSAPATGEVKRGAEVARVLLRSGAVRIVGGPKAKPKAKTDPARLTAGSTVRVAQGRAALALPDEANALLSENSSVRVVEILSQTTTLYLERGELLVSLKPKRHRRRFVVVTHAGRIEVTGTIFSVRVAETVTVRVLRGTVRVVEPGKPPRYVHRGQTTTLGTVDRTVRALTADQERTALVRVAILGLLGTADAASLTIRSRPTDAVVSVDGVVIGRTPLQANLLAGHRRLVVARTGRAPVQEQLTLRPGDRVARDYELSQTLASKGVPASKTLGPAALSTPKTAPPNDTPLMTPVVIRPSPRVVSRRPDRGVVQATIRELMQRARKLRKDRKWRGAANAYRELLRQYPKTAAARVSRVALGMLLLDHLGQSAGALSLFNVYLSSTRRGVLATEAAYGRIRALRRLRRRTAELSALREFLKYYPGALQTPLVKRRLKALATPAVGGAKR